MAQKLCYWHGCLLLAILCVHLAGWLKLPFWPCVDVYGDRKIFALCHDDLAPVLQVPNGFWQQISAMDFLIRCQILELFLSVKYDMFYKIKIILDLYFVFLKFPYEIFSQLVVFLT